MSGFSSFGPGGPRREGGDREEEHSRDGQEVIRKPLSQATKRAIMDMPTPQEEIPSSIPEVEKELMGLSLAELKERQVALDGEYNRVVHQLEITSKIINSGLAGAGEEAKRQGLLTRKTDLYYKLQAVQRAIEARDVSQEVPKEKE